MALKTSGLIASVAGRTGISIFSVVLMMGCASARNDVVSHIPESQMAEGYAKAIRASLAAENFSVLPANHCKVHLIDLRHVQGWAGGAKRYRLYYVLTGHDGVLKEADTCGFSMGECASAIAARVRAMCAPG